MTSVGLSTGVSRLGYHHIDGFGVYLAGYTNGAGKTIPLQRRTSWHRETALHRALNQRERRRRGQGGKTQDKQS